ncbi:MAG: PaaI family thioesterase [Desulfopila sp.]
MTTSSAKDLLGNHDNCVICGSNNPFSLGLQFVSQAGGAVEATFIGGPHLQGYEGILHGGVISAVLDSAMAHCLLAQDIKAVTGDLRVRFLHAIPCTSKVTIRAWLTCAVSTLYELKAEARVDGQLVARAKAKFMQRDQGG